MPSGDLEPVAIIKKQNPEADGFGVFLFVHSNDPEGGIIRPNRPIPGGNWRIRSCPYSR